MAKPTLIIVNSCASIALAAALTSHAVAHELDTWLNSSGFATYTVSVDGYPVQYGAVNGSGFTYVTFGDGQHVTITPSAGLSISYQVYDGNAVGPRWAYPPVSDDVPIPSQALAAGFNTVVLNSDFSQPVATNWLGGCPNGADWNPPLSRFADDTGHDWYWGLWDFWPDPYGLCSTTQTTDPDGKLTLDIPWLISTSNYFQGVGLQSASLDYDRTNFNPARGEALGIPNNFYVEAEFRMSPVEPGSFGSVIMWTTDGIASETGAGLEYDISEWDAGVPWGSDMIVHNFPANTSSPWIMAAPQFNPIDPYTYQRFGMRSTSDGQQMSVCGYVNDVLQKCVMVPGINPVIASQRYFIAIQMFCDYWNFHTPCNGRDGEWEHMLVRSVKVWSCPSWQTTQCNGPILAQ